MKLSAPKHMTWYAALAAGALGLALHYGVLHVGALQPYAFLLVAGAWLLLILGTALRALLSAGARGSRSRFALRAVVV